VVSLFDGFIFAGAGSVVATLWPVSDEGTQRLMESFH
jgi:CHAT domain-containing protein